MKPLCTNLLAVNGRSHSGEIAAIRCKRWSCDVCREINRRRVIGLALNGKPTAMLTLTVSSKHWANPDAAAAELKRGLVALRKRIKRRWPSETMPFLAVFEEHKSGYPHLHLLIRARFIPVNWLRKVWTEITGSWNVNICAIKTSGQAAMYAAKYIGKNLAAFAHCKRWWRSHDYKQPKDDADDAEQKRKSWQTWEAEPGPLLSAFRVLGATVEKSAGERWTWKAPPDRPVPIGEAARLANSWWRRAPARPLNFGARR